jgi:hypothetical protein
LIDREPETLPSPLWRATIPEELSNSYCYFLLQRRVLRRDAGAGGARHPVAHASTLSVHDYVNGA